MEMEQRSEMERKMDEKKEEKEYNRKEEEEDGAEEEEGEGDEVKEKEEEVSGVQQQGRGSRRGRQGERGWGRQAYFRLEGSHDIIHITYYYYFRLKFIHNYVIHVRAQCKFYGPYTFPLQ